MRRSILFPAQVLVIIGLSIAACSPQRREAADTAAPDSAAVAPSGDQMAGMAQMAGGDMSAQMRAHMQMMEGMRGDSLRGMLATHRQMGANMLSEFNRQMVSMNTKADARWTALMDSARADLSRMPSMSSAELERAMPAHHARMRGLMEMHRGMMRR